MRLRFDWRWRPHRQDQAGLEPEQGVQARLQALEGGPRKSAQTDHQVARSPGKNKSSEERYVFIEHIFALNGHKSGLADGQSNL